MSKDTGQFNPKGGDLIWVSEVNPTTYAVVTPVVPITANAATLTGMELGHLVSSQYDSAQSETNEEFLTEDKTQLADYITTTYKPITEAIMYERGKLRRDFFRYRVIGKTYVQCHYLGIVDGFYQEEFSFGTITPQANNSFYGGNTYRYKFNKIKMSANTTLASVDKGLIVTAYGIVSPSSAAASVVLSGQYDILTETAV